MQRMTVRSISTLLAAALAAAFAGPAAAQSTPPAAPQATAVPGADAIVVNADLRLLMMKIN